MLKVRRNNMENKKIPKYNFDRIFFSYVNEQDRLKDILGLSHDIVLKILNSGFIFDYDDNMFLSSYDFKISENKNITFSLKLGKRTEGYYLYLTHEETELYQYFMTTPDFNNFINPINLLFQLKTFVETDKKIPLFFSIIDDIDSCTKNENGYVELLNENIENINRFIPVLLNDKIIIYRKFTTDKNQLSGRLNYHDYGFVDGYYNSETFKTDTIRTIDGRIALWQGQKNLHSLNNNELETISEALKETLEVKNKKTFKKFVQEENKLEPHD